MLVGGDFQGKNPNVQNAFRTYVGPDATIKADAITNGNGGKVVVWADDVTRFYGNVSTRGGAQSGDGGNVEVSGKGTLDFSGLVVTAAPFGRNGTLLLDPTNIEVINGGGASVANVSLFANANFGGCVNIVAACSAISPATIQTTANAGGGTNVTLQATNDILFTDPITIAPAAAFPSIDLTFAATAGRNITVNANISVTGGREPITTSISKSGIITLDAGNAITVANAVTIAATGGGTVLIFNNESQNAKGQVNLTAGAGGITLTGSGAVSATGGTSTFTGSAGGNATISITTTGLTGGSLQTNGGTGAAGQSNSTTPTAGSAGGVASITANSTATLTVTGATLTTTGGTGGTGGSHTAGGAGASGGSGGAASVSLTGATQTNLNTGTAVTVTGGTGGTGGTGTPTGATGAAGTATASVTSTTGGITFGTATTTFTSLSLALNFVTTLDLTGNPNFTGVTAVTANGTAAGTIAGPNIPNTWNITGANTGTLSIFIGTPINFSNVGGLTGGTNTDSFTGVAGGSLSGNLADGGGATALSGTITTVGSQTYNGAVTLGANTTLNAGAGAINFASTVNGLFSLDANSTGVTTFGGAVGGTNALTGLTTNAGGSTFISGGAITTNGAIGAASVAVTGAATLGGNVTTTGNQSYGGAVNLSTSSILTSSANGQIQFVSTVDGAQALTVNTSGVTRFDAPVGNTTALTTLTTDVPGTTIINSSIRTTGAINLNDAVSGNNLTLNAGASPITLPNAGNDFAGTLTLTGSTATVSDVNALTVVLNTTGANNLSAGGAISATGNFSNLTASTTGAGSGISAISCTHVHGDRRGYQQRAGYAGQHSGQSGAKRHYSFRHRCP